MVGARLDAKAEVGADHGAEKFDRAFFHGVRGGAVPSGEIAVEAMLGAGSVTAFVEQYRVVGNRIPEAGEVWHLHIVPGGDVAGLRSAVANVDGQRRAEAFGVRDPLDLGKHRHLGRRVAVDLGAVEDGVAAGD